jgi:checkpoint serine/threonine-protein kinase
MDKDWRRPKEPLQQISGNAPGEAPPAKLKIYKDEPLSERPVQKLATDEQLSQSPHQDGHYEGKAGKARKFKVQGETQTSEWLFVKLCFVSARLTLFSQSK